MRRFSTPSRSIIAEIPGPGAGVLVVVVDTGRPDRAERVASGLRNMLRSRKREVETRVVSTRGEEGLGPILERVAEESNLPLILVTTAIEPWTAAHLDPLLTAIDRCDHVYGRRECGIPQSLIRRLVWMKWKALFAMPVVDVHSACRLHRKEALADTAVAVGFGICGCGTAGEGDVSRPPDRRGAGAGAADGRGTASGAVEARRSRRVPASDVQEGPGLRSSGTCGGRGRSVPTAQALRMARGTPRAVIPAPSSRTIRRPLQSWVRGRAAMTGCMASG